MFVASCEKFAFQMWHPVQVKLGANLVTKMLKCTLTLWLIETTPTFESTTIVGHSLYLHHFPLMLFYPGGGADEFLSSSSRSFR